MDEPPLNPKLITFSVALLPQFADTGRGEPWAQFAVFGATPVVPEF